MIKRELQARERVRVVLMPSLRSNRSLDYDMDNLSTWRDAMTEVPLLRRTSPPTMVDENSAAGSFRVHRGAFVDEDVLEREKARIFDHCWLYAMHESEVAKPGDFVSRKVGGKPLMFVRDRAGVLRAFFNACPHRGMSVCREKSGSARTFT